MSEWIYRPCQKYVWFEASQKNIIDKNQSSLYGIVKVFW
jgi:hypothetical protein